MSDMTFYVVGAEQPKSESGKVAEIPGQGTDLHSIKAIRQWFAPTAKEVSADKLIESFEKTQKAIDAMLSKLDAQEKRGYRLDEFEVSLGVTGEGTIGIVTASAEASVVLKFKRS